MARHVSTAEPGSAVHARGRASDQCSAAGSGVCVMRDRSRRAAGWQAHPGLRDQAVGAMLWMGANRVAGQVIDQVFTLVLVRLLVPGDFGIIAMAAVFTALLNVVS